MVSLVARPIALAFCRYQSGIRLEKGRLLRRIVIPIGHPPPFITSGVGLYQIVIEVYLCRSTTQFNVHPFPHILVRY